MLIGCPPSLIRRPCFRNSPASAWNSNGPNQQTRSDALDSGLPMAVDISVEVRFYTNLSPVTSR